MRWQQVGPSTTTNGATLHGVTRVNVTGRVTAIVVNDAGTIFVGTARGGVWRSCDRGATWQPMSDAHTSLAIGALAAAPSDQDTLYAGTGEGNLYIPCQLAVIRPESLYGNGLLVSRDAGDTWNERASDVFTRAAFFKIAVDPAKATIVYAATTLGLHRSRDGGATWERMGRGLPPIPPPTSSTPYPATDVLIDPDNAQIVYAAFWGSGIYRTIDAYSDTPKWARILGPKAGGSDLGRIAVATAPKQQLLWALLTDPDGGIVALLHTPKAGPGTWTSVLANSIGALLEQLAFYALVLAVDPKDANTIYAGAENLSRFSMDTVQSQWRYCSIGDNLHADHHAVAFDPHDRSTIYFGNDGGIFCSTDRGDTFDDSINNGLCTLEVISVARFPGSQTILLGTHDNGAQVLKGGNADTVDDGDIGTVMVDPKNSQIAYETARSGPSKSTQPDTLRSFKPLTGFAGNGAFYPPLDIDPTDSNNIAYGAAPYVNIDPAKGANSWPTNVRLGGIKGDIISLTFVNSNLILVGTSACEMYYVSRDAAGTWGAVALSSPSLSPQSQWVCDIKALKPDGSSFIIALSGYDVPHVWRADVAQPVEATWSNISGVGPGALPNSPATALAVDGRTIYVGTDVGIYATSNGGASWSRTSDGLPNAGVNQLLLDEANGVLLAATNGRGIWQLPI